MLHFYSVFICFNLQCLCKQAHAFIFKFKFKFDIHLVFISFFPFCSWNCIRGISFEVVQGRSFTKGQNAFLGANEEIHWVATKCWRRIWIRRGRLGTQLNFSLYEYKNPFCLSLIHPSSKISSIGSNSKQNHASNKIQQQQQQPSILTSNNLILN